MSSATPDKSKDIAKQVVKALLEDMTDRRGLRQAWESIDGDIRKTIRRAWEKQTVAILKEWEGKAPKDSGDWDGDCG